MIGIPELLSLAQRQYHQPEFADAPSGVASISRLRCRENPEPGSHTHFLSLSSAVSETEQKGALLYVRQTSAAVSCNPSRGVRTNKMRCLSSTSSLVHTRWCICGSLQIARRQLPTLHYKKWHAPHKLRYRMQMWSCINDINWCLSRFTPAPKGAPTRLARHKCEDGHFG